MYNSTSTLLKDYENSVYDKLAIEIQRLFRGMKTRMKVRALRYDSLNDKVRRIQRCYRKWRMFQFYRMRRSHMLSDDTVTGNWKEVITGHGSFDERMVVWRSIIEMRRAYPQFNTELCLRALTLGEGDTQRGNIVIGYPDFYMRYQSAPSIPKYQRDCFLPCMCPGATYLAPPSDPASEAQPAGLIFTGSGPGRKEKPIKITANGNIRQQILDEGTVAPGSVNFSPALINSFFCVNPSTNKYNGGNQENIGNTGTTTTTTSKRSGKTTRRPKSANATSTSRNSKSTTVSNKTSNKKPNTGTFILEDAHTSLEFKGSNAMEKMINCGYDYNYGSNKIK